MVALADVGGYLTEVGRGIANELRLYGAPVRRICGKNDIALAIGQIDHFDGGNGTHADSCQILRKRTPFLCAALTGIGCKSCGNAIGIVGETRNAEKSARYVDVGSIDLRHDANGTLRHGL